jgi:predicted O-methyltransferase YrrM
LHSLKVFQTNLFGTVSSPKQNRAGSHKLYYPPGHFYSPIVDPAEADRHLSAIESRPSPESVPGIVIDRAEMVRTWHKLLPLILDSPFGGTPSSDCRYSLENPYYSWGDGNVLQAMIRLYRPKRIIEIGSGWSSVCMADTVTHYLDGDCELTFIEAHPQRLHDLLGAGIASKNIAILESRVQDVATDIFDRLSTADILFIDSSHVLRTGSDVCYELFDIMPRLAAGVLVHIHDIFWPFEYPRRWAVDENRSWNELYAVRALLTHNECWNIVLFNSYLAQLERDLIGRTYPDFYRRSTAALWLQRR